MTKKNNYYILFGGAKINKLQGNRLGIGLIFALVGIAITLFLPIGNKYISYLIIISFSLFGYFLIGPLIFKKNKIPKQE